MSAAAVSYVATVCSADAELIHSFMQTSCGQDGKSGMTNLRGMADVCIEPILPRELEDESAMHRLRETDLCVVLVRSLDRGSVQRLREVVRRLPSRAMENLHVTICRHAGEAEYKISCTKCSQNLIVRDAMAFARVKCPHCHDVFMVPGETDLIRTELLLNASQLVRKITIGDRPSCLAALEQMVGQVRRQMNADKKSTIRIELPEADGWRPGVGPSDPPIMRRNTAFIW